MQVINWDQTGMQLVPAGNAHTYHTKNSLDVSVANGDDKRGYTAVLASTASGKMLPLQVIYGGAKGSLRALPNVLCRATVAAKGFVFAQTPIHWSGQGSIRKYIIGMIDPYVKSVIKASNGQLPVDQKAVLLIDCWSVHKSEEFLSWMKEEYPHLIILFVPGGTTSKFQPADTSLNRPFKATIKATYHLWYAQDVGQQLQGHAVDEVKVGTAVGVMHDLSVGWLLSSWERLNGDASIVKKAWQITGLHAAFDRQVQRAARKMRDASKLWRVPQGYDAEIGDEDEQQLFSKGFDSEPDEDDLVPLAQLAARATAKAAGASSSAAAAVASIQDVAAQAIAAEEYLQIDEQLALQSEVLQAGMEAYAVRVAAATAEAATDSLLALDENAPVDNVEGGEVAVENPGHFDSAQDGEGDDDAM
jgi:hypothetical protein